MNVSPAKGTRDMQGAKDVAVERLFFGYGGRPVLKGVDLEADAGSITAVVGPNGSGKSTLLKVISGYLCPSGGSVSIRGLMPHDLSSAERSRLVTYCGDEPEPAFPFTVEEAVSLGRVAAPDRTTRAARAARPTTDGSSRTVRAMDDVGVLELRDRAITALSSGERQRVYLARAVCQDPQVFLLDEPTAHLDMSYELHVMEMVARMVRDRGKTVIAVHHDLNLALRYASRLFFLKEGTVRYSLGPLDVTAQVIGEVYGVHATVARHPSLGCPFIIPESPLR